ncbi:MAG: phosphatidate cytidylyltransferase [Planctomycetota bacterium]
MTSAARSASRLETLVSRAIVTVIAAGGFAGLCWADATGLFATPPGWWLAPVAALLAFGAAAEAVRMAVGRGLVAGGLFVPLTTAAIPLAAVAATHAPATAGAGPAAIIGWAAVAAWVAVAVACAAEIARYRHGGASLARLAVAALAVTAIGLPLAFMVGLRLVPAAAAVDGPACLVPLVSMVAVVKGGDIAAYVVGSLVGRWKLAPVVSPGKTWEGASASLVASLAVAWFILERSGWSGGPQPWGGWAGYGLAVGVAGMLGDLSESLVKRELSAKDSGRSLGGLGGFLDLIDATLVAAPVAWILWVLG